MTPIAWATWNGHHHWWICALIVALLIAVAVVLVRRRRRAPRAGGSARTILAERYARGELTAEEYRERLTTLDGP